MSIRQRNPLKHREIIDLVNDDVVSVPPELRTDRSGTSRGENNLGLHKKRKRTTESSFRPFRSSTTSTSLPFSSSSSTSSSSNPHNRRKVTVHWQESKMKRPTSLRASLLPSSINLSKERSSAFSSVSSFRQNTSLSPSLSRTNDRQKRTFIEEDLGSFPLSGGDEDTTRINMKKRKKELEISSPSQTITCSSLLRSNSSPAFSSSSSPSTSSSSSSSLSTNPYSNHWKPLSHVFETKTSHPHHTHNHVQDIEEEDEEEEDEEENDIDDDADDEVDDVHESDDSEECSDDDVNPLEPSNLSSLDPISASDLSSAVSDPTYLRYHHEHHDHHHHVHHHYIPTPHFHLTTNTSDELYPSFDPSTSSISSPSTQLPSPYLSSTLTLPSLHGHSNSHSNSSVSNPSLSIALQTSTFTTSSSSSNNTTTSSTSLNFGLSGNFLDLTRSSTVHSFVAHPLPISFYTPTIAATNFWPPFSLPSSSLFSASPSGERHSTNSYSTNVLHIHRLLQQLHADRLRYPQMGENNSNNENPFLRLMTRDLNSNDFEILSELDEEKKGFSVEEIERLPTNRITAEEASKRRQCCICICEFEEDEEVRRLTCFHAFHRHCIDKWLSRSKNCPIDNQRIQI